MAPSTRRPAALYRDGDEPDPRFSLANERTYLAWTRTALAFIAGGVALEALDVPAQPGLRLGAALLLNGVGMLAGIQAWVGWFDTERALRRGAPLPPARLQLPITGGLLVVALALVAGLLAR